MIREFSVTQINEYITDIIKRDYVLSSVCIKGEISNCRDSSGHIFFTMKDSSCQLAAVMFSSAKATGLKCRLRDGMKVKATGYIGVYMQSGRYQLYCSKIEEDGIGSVYEQFEALKARLNAEGLFDSKHKLELPRYIKTLGVITAINGAAVRDIINVTQRRNPHVKIIVYPAIVQGNGAAETLISGLKKMEQIRPDCIIIGRGGGSAEDLWCFNDEELARAVYSCTVPIISAVGHEIDFTIIDFVADQRAATPSAAAEIATYEYTKLRSELVEYRSSLLSSMLSNIDKAKLKNEKYSLAIRNFSPGNRIDNFKLRSIRINEALNTAINDKINNTNVKIARQSDRLLNSFKLRLTNNRHHLELLRTKLEAISPENKLLMGYAYVTDEQGKNVSSVKDVRKGSKLNLRVKDGSVSAVVD